MIMGGLAEVMAAGNGKTADCSGNPQQVTAKKDQIDESLKRVYNDMLEDDVPDRFEDLLRKLREQDAQK